MGNNLLKSLVIGTAMTVGLTGRLDAEPISVSKAINDTGYYFTMNKSSYGLGETIDMTCRMTNLKPEPRTYGFVDGQWFDFIMQKDGAEIYRWSQGYGFIAAFTEFTLASGESKEFNEQWTQIKLNENPQSWDDYGQVTAGNYNIESIWYSADWPEAKISLNIEINNITPEPATLALLGAGWAAEELTRRLRRKRKGTENSFVGPGNPYGL